jgi:hypothetical protein
MSVAHQILILTLQILLVLPLVWQIGRFLVNPRELFSPKTVVAGGFVGLYVASYYFVDGHDRDAFLTVDGYLSLLLVAVLACYAFWTGFILGRGARAPRERPCHGQTVRWYAIALIGIGFVSQAAFIAKSGGFGAFYGAPHGAGGVWAGTSAYLYALSGLMFPAMCLLCAIFVREGVPGLLAPLTFLAALAYGAFQAFAFGNRGDTIRLFLMLLLPPLFLAGRLHVRRRSVLLATTVALTAVLLFPHLREALHPGAEKSLVQVVSEVFVDDAISLGHSKVTGHELFYAAAVVEAASEQQTHDYGFAWIYPFINLVPRAWWPDKPYAADWSINQPGLVRLHAGWIVADGAASTGIADTFLGFSWLSLVVWLAFGWWGGVTWARATTTNSVTDVAYLWAFLVIAVYFVTQGYHAAWHACLYYMIPIWFLSFLVPTMAGRPEVGQVTFASARAHTARKLRAPAP